MAHAFAKLVAEAFQASSREAEHREEYRPTLGLAEGRGAPRETNPSYLRRAVATSPSLRLDPPSFMARYWQRRPVLFRGALSGFRDPLTSRELFALATREDAESRLVRQVRGRRGWEVTWGPLPRGFARRLPRARWTVLVQDVNRHVTGAARLLDHFAFIPNVRVDDVMVSHAARGGSVGPHVDSYDVFLVQGSGTRRWRWGARPLRDPAFLPGLDLKVLERFHADHEAVLEAGDVLYLPPGFAHHGVAESPCLTYSVGFRAPTAGALWTAYAEDAAGLVGGEAVLSDPHLGVASNPGIIPEGLLVEVRRTLRALPRPDPDIDRWFGAFATRGVAAQRPPRPRRAPVPTRVLAGLRRGGTVLRSESLRYALLLRSRGAWLYVGGEEIDVPASALGLALLVAGRREMSALEVLAAARGRAAVRLLCSLLAMGALTVAR